MFIRKWRTPEWAMLSIGFGLLLLVVILSLAPSADAAPLQNSHAKPKKYASTSADNYNYTRESQSSVVHLNAYYRWPLPDCKHPKKGKHDWFGTASVTIRTKKQRTIFGMASHNAGHIGDEIDGAVIFP
jgi:hypothetical protein